MPAVAVNLQAILVDSVGEGFGTGILFALDSLDFLSASKNRYYKLLEYVMYCDVMSCNDKFVFLVVAFLMVWVGILMDKFCKVCSPCEACPCHYIKPEPQQR